MTQVTHNRVSVIRLPIRLPLHNEQPRKKKNVGNTRKENRKKNEVDRLLREVAKEISRTGYKRAAAKQQMRTAMTRNPSGALTIRSGMFFLDTGQKGFEPSFYLFSITGLNTSCSFTENTCALISTVLISDVSPEAAKIMLSTTNW